MSIIFASQKKLDAEISKRAAELSEQVIMEMGAELHDDLIQRLSVFRLYIDRLERVIHNPSETEDLLMNMRTDFESVVQSVRRISRSLLPEQTLVNSFNERIQTLCQSLERPGMGNIYFDSMGTEQVMPAVSMTYLSRIIQELIHNAFKHSSAWHVWVHLMWEEKQLRIEVEDDGSGFNKISEFIDRLRKKNNTLKIRSTIIGATMSYHHGNKGLLARVAYKF
jgi:two-component system sensor histidine kinase DegS